MDLFHVGYEEQRNTKVLLVSDFRALWIPAGQESRPMKSTCKIFGRLCSSLSSLLFLECDKWPKIALSEQLLCQLLALESHRKIRNMNYIVRNVLKTWWTVVCREKWTPGSSTGKNHLVTRLVEPGGLSSRNHTESLVATPDRSSLDNKGGISFDQRRYSYLVSISIVWFSFNCNTCHLRLYCVHLKLCCIFMCI